MKTFYSLIKTLMICLLIISLTSCATIVHGTRQSVGISSKPSDAAIWVDRVYAGQTPLIVEMSRKENHVVTIALDGYQTYEVVFSKKVSGWVAGNIVFGGFIGLAVDALSGGIYKLTPEQVQAELVTSHVNYSKKSSNDSYITIVLAPNPAWQKIGNLTVTN